MPMHREKTVSWRQPFPHNLSYFLFSLFLSQVSSQGEDSFQSIAECCHAICSTATAVSQCIELVPSKSCPQLSYSDDYCTCRWDLLDIANNITYTQPRCVIDIKEFQESAPVSGSTAFIVLLALSILLCGCGCAMCWFCFVRIPEDDKEGAVANPGEAAEGPPPTPSSRVGKAIQGLRRARSLTDVKKAVKSAFSDEEDDEEADKNDAVPTTPTAERRSLAPPPPKPTTRKSVTNVKETAGAKKDNGADDGGGVDGSRRESTKPKTRPEAINNQDTSGFGFRTAIYPEKPKEGKERSQARRGSAPPTPTHMRDIQLKMSQGASGKREKGSRKSLSPEDYMKRRLSMNPHMRQPSSQGRMHPRGPWGMSGSDRVLLARQQQWEQENWRRNSLMAGMGRYGQPYPKARSNSMMPLGHVRPPMMDEGSGLVLQAGWPQYPPDLGLPAGRRSSHIPTVREVALQAQQAVLMEQQHGGLDPARRASQPPRRYSQQPFPPEFSAVPPAGFPGGPGMYHPQVGTYPEMGMQWPPGLDTRPWGGSVGQMAEYGAPQAPSSAPASPSDSRRSLLSQGPLSGGSSRSLGSPVSRDRGSNRSLRDLEQAALRGGSSGNLGPAGQKVVKDVDGVVLEGGHFHADRAAYDPRRDKLKFQMSDGPGMRHMAAGDPSQFMTDAIMEGSAESRTHSRKTSVDSEEDGEEEMLGIGARGSGGWGRSHGSAGKRTSAWEEGEKVLSELAVQERLAAERRSGMMRHPGPGPDASAAELGPGDAEFSRKALRGGAGGGEGRATPPLQRTPTPTQSGNPQEEVYGGGAGGPVHSWRRGGGAHRRDREPAYSVV